jgi:hypothetical protein
MKNNVEVSPYIFTICDQKIKTELYNRFFDVKHIGNSDGSSMPVNGQDYHETNEGYINRLKKWKLKDREILFDGWIVKDLIHWQTLENPQSNASIDVEFNTYKIRLYDKEYKFPILPDTIDDFINDCKRIGLKLFWKQEIIDKFGIDKITSPHKVIEYHRIIRENLN